MWAYNYSDELYHHGIKGQKWGVRRYQNEDGTLTSAGRRKYKTESKQSIISKHKENLVNKYIEKGYSREAAETAAKQRLQTELIVGVVGTVAAVGIGSKVIRNIGREYCDKIIKSGETIQNIGPKADTTFKDAPFFAAINKSDKKTYSMMYPKEKKNDGTIFSR